MELETIISFYSNTVKRHLSPHLKSKKSCDSNRVHIEEEEGEMDNVTLRRKLSTYLSSKGYLKNVPEDLLYEILIAWENWTSSSKEFYSSLGFTQTQMAALIGKAKKLKREGYFGDGDFKQIQVSQEINVPSDFVSSNTCSAAEIVMSDGKIIRFTQIDYLLDFLKKSA